MSTSDDLGLADGRRGVLHGGRDRLGGTGVDADGVDVVLVRVGQLEVGDGALVLLHHADQAGGAVGGLAAPAAPVLARLVGPGVGGGGVTRTS